MSIHNGDQTIDQTIKYFLKSSIDTYESYSDRFLCYEAGKFHRFEDFFRDKKRVLIYRGTFNPITNAHLEMYEKAIEQEDPDFSCLMIAHSIFDKPGLGIEEIKERMNYADALGIPLVIGDSFRYLDTIKQFRIQQFEKTDTEICFLMGADTIERIFDYEKPGFWNHDAYKNVVYLYCNRKGRPISGDNLELFDNHLSMSSGLSVVEIIDFDDHNSISATQVREFLKTANLEETAKMIPAKILQTIIKNQLIKK